MIVNFGIGVRMSWTNAPTLRWVPPDTRLSARTAFCTGGTTGPGAALYQSSWLSPSTQCQSVPALKYCLVPSAFAHWTTPPAAVVGTT